MKLNISKIKKVLLGLGVLGFFAVSQAALADAKALGDLALTATSSFSGLGKLLFAISYVCGFGLAVIAIFLFKKHRDNPQQTALGVPVGMLVIGVGLIFLPTLLGSAGMTLFGADRQASDFTGSGYEINLSDTSS
ncbi:MAG TPA: type IV secretion protein IcmD [Gammaproteobacteria bacterium]|nr:type IV secretion protein IcmD [Gammaproteobacteria bacterium]